MSMLAAEPVPIRVDEHGTYRVGGTRITLDIVLDQHFAGSSPEQIVKNFPTLELADVYAVISYALRHPDEVQAYLRKREREASELRQQLESSGVTPKDTSALKSKLQAKMQARTRDSGAKSNGAAPGG